MSQDTEELEQENEELEKRYYELYPPGTISADGRWVMREDGKWWGRCKIIKERNGNKEPVDAG